MKRIIELLGIAVFAIGISAITGYVLDVKCLYAFTPNPMALNAAVSIVLTGIALFVIGKKL